MKHVIFIFMFVTLEHRDNLEHWKKNWKMKYKRKLYEKDFSNIKNWNETGDATVTKSDVNKIQWNL